MQQGNTAGRARMSWWRWGSPFWQRLGPPIAFFAVAFAIDMLTGQRYSSIWGSMAIVASLISLFPAMRPALIAIGMYGGVWVVFNVLRAFSEDAGLAIGGQEAVADMERSLFGGTLPSTSLQDRLFDPENPGVHDVLLSLVHGSFFIVPFVVAAIVWRKRDALFRSLTVATAFTFALGVVGFVLLPTSPPWLAAPDEVTRVTHSILADTTGTGADAALSFEPNHLAAMPSVHVAATVLVYLVAREFGRIPSILGLIYALLMSFGVVYLGEHYIVDALGGWIIALAGWMLMRRVVGNEPAHRQTVPATHAGSTSAPAGHIDRS
jgi:membrane-associated phospholipid phosphatase